MVTVHIVPKYMVSVKIKSYNSGIHSRSTNLKVALYSLGE